MPSGRNLCAFDTFTGINIRFLSLSPRYINEGKVTMCNLPSSRLYSATIRGQTLVEPSSVQRRHMTCGDQQKMKINAAATSIFARRRRERNVDVWGSGSSDEGGFFGWRPGRCWPLRIDLNRNHIELAVCR